MKDSNRKNSTAIVEAGLAKRYAKEKRFRLMGLSAVAVSVLFLAFLLVSIAAKGIPAFQATYIKLDIPLDSKALRLPDEPTLQDISRARYDKPIKTALLNQFPEVSKRKEKRALYKLVSSYASRQVADAVVANPELLNTTASLWLLADDEVAALARNAHYTLDKTGAKVERTRAQIEALRAEGRLETRFNWLFFQRGDSREPEAAGIKGAIMGSFYTLLVTLALSFPIGVAAAVYLEEFAPKNRLTDIIEVNINNLAAVPSIVFGLLGVAVFINFFHLPRSAPLVGGVVLSLMTLPTIIIASRAALKSVPPSIADAALGLGASKIQSITHHVLPLAMPGILTGTIIGMAQALGESAPLLMIGMVAFIVDVPGGVTDPATVLPVQVYLWSDSPERAFTERTSGAIMVLLVFLIMMNFLAVLLRKQFERRW
ncbi:MAG: phosphate ABC transporter permease PstA [Granulosicoccaceae bacterium]